MPQILFRNHLLKTVHVQFSKPHTCHRSRTVPLWTFFRETASIFRFLFGSFSCLSIVVVDFWCSARFIIICVSELFILKKRCPVFVYKLYFRSKSLACNRNHNNKRKWWSFIISSICRMQMFWFELSQIWQSK